MQQPVPFGKYILLERISVGGMAEVFKAKSFGVKGFAKIIAIKKILPHLAEDDHFVDMFVAEAKMAVQLTHANICQIFDLGRIGADHYIAMEYISGKDLLSLHNYFRRTRSRMPIALAAYVGARVAEGLDYAHRKRGPDGEPIGIVHRDISPQNVIVSYDGGVKLIDFGIAKARVRNYRDTQAGVLKGKFGYMSPEQVEGLEIDHRSDIFALGTVIHELLTGRRLFLGESDFATLEKVRDAEAPPPSAVNPDIPPELDRILLRALARDRDQRYSTAAEMSEDLARWLHTSGEPFSSKALADWMVAHFAEEIAKEKARHEIYAQIDGYPSVDEGQDGPASTLSDEDDDEETALWEPLAEQQAAMAAAAAAAGPPGRSAAARAHAEPTWVNPEDTVDPGLPLQGTQVTGDAPSRRDLPSAPTPRPFPAPTMPPRPRRSGRRDLMIGALLLVAATAGGVLAYRAIEPAPAVQDKAQLVLRVEPSEDLSIYLDNQLVAARSPYVKNDLAPGAYTLRVERTGYRPWKSAVELSAGQLRDWTVKLEAAPNEPAKVRFQTFPADATLELDGRKVTSTERAGYIELGGGRPVQLVVRRDGFLPHTETLRPEAGVSRTLEIKLSPSNGTLFIDSDPPGDAFLNGKRLGRTPQTADGLDVTRPWKVRIEREGFATYEGQVIFGERRSVQVEQKLVPQR